MISCGANRAIRLSIAGAVGLMMSALTFDPAEAQEHKVPAEATRVSETPEPEEAAELDEEGEPDKVAESEAEPDATPPDPQTDEPQPTFAFEGDSFAADLTISGVVNRAFLVWDDGGESDAYYVDNAQEGTFLGVEGNVEFGDGWTIGAVFGVDIIFAPSDEVDQFDAIGFDNGLSVSDLYASIGQERLGTIVVGYADSASDGIDNMNFADSDTLADADVTNWNANFLIRPTGEELSDLRWGDFIDGTLAGDTRRSISYTTPELMGFEGSAAASEDYWDLALRYSGEWVEILEIETGVGYWEDTLSDSPEPVDDSGVGGSIAVRHMDTGLNIALDVGTASHTDRCEDPGEISSQCSGDDFFYYVKGGIVRDFTEWGATSIYGELYRERKQPNESDEDVLAQLERVEGEALEMQDSVATVWGIGVVQKIDAWNAEVYAGYRHYHLDVDLIGDAGQVADKGIDEFDAVMAGAAFRF